MIKIKLCWATAWLFFGLAGTAQECNFLDARNGFRDVKLGSNVTSYPDFSRQNPDNKHLFEKYDPDADYVYLGKVSDNIQNARILYIFVKAKDGIISEISVITNKMVGISALLRASFWRATVRFRTSHDLEGRQNTMYALGRRQPVPRL